MSGNEEFAAGILTSASGALSGFAASCLLDAQPELAARFGDAAFPTWKRWFADRISDLSSSMIAGSELLFVKQVLWSRSFLASHGVQLGDLRPAIECLAAALQENLPEEASTAVKRYLQAAAASIDQPDQEPGRLVPDSPDNRLAATYLVALLEGDRQRATRLLLEAAEQGRSLVDIYLQVLTPALEEVGRMWTLGEITVAEEHFVTTSARETMIQLRHTCPTAASNGRTVLAAGVAGNQHDIGLQMVADVFELAGWRAINLGANVPVHDVVQAIENFEAQVLMLSAALTNHLPAVRQTILAIRGSGKPATKILVGGQAFDVSASVALELGADGYAATAVEALSLAEQIVV